MFLGYPVSGHSLIGALLDAHPNIVIAHELDTLKYVYAGYCERQLYYLLVSRSQSFANQECNTRWYSYHVANQFQGTNTQIRVIGDKHGESTTLRLRACPWLFERLSRTITKPVLYVHVIRNPYDNISSIHRRKGISLWKSIDYYFSLCETVAVMRHRITQNNLLELRHETFVENPTAELKHLCRFLGVEAHDNYVIDCSAIVFKAASKTRSHAPWDSKAIDLVQQRIEHFSFLHGYVYDPIHTP